MEQDFGRFAREQRAVAEIGRRSSALEMKVLELTLFGTAVPAILGTLLFSEWVHASFSVNRLILRGGFFAGVGVVVLVEKLLARPLVRARRVGWIEQLAHTHDVPPDALRAALVG